MPMLKGLPQRADRVSEAVRRHPDVFGLGRSRGSRGASPVFARTIQRLETARPRPKRRYVIRRETALQRRMRRLEDNREWMRKARTIAAGNKSKRGQNP